jgi:hypothetical protein
LDLQHLKETLQIYLKSNLSHHIINKLFKNKAGRYVKLFNLQKYMDNLLKINGIK